MPRKKKVTKPSVVFDITDPSTWPKNKGAVPDCVFAVVCVRTTDDGQTETKYRPVGISWKHVTEYAKRMKASGWTVHVYYGQINWVGVPGGVVKATPPLRIRTEWQRAHTYD